MGSKFFALAVLIAPRLFPFRLEDFLVLKDLASALPLATHLSLLCALAAEVSASRAPSRVSAASGAAREGEARALKEALALEVLG